MTPSEREQDGKSGALLGPDVVLKVDSRISTGSHAAVVGPTSEFSNGQALVEGQVVLSTVRAFERRLVALVDGQRTVKDVIQLSGLSEAQAKRHLASLCRRRVLIPIDAHHAPDPAAPLETESDESRKTPSWASKARPALTDQDKTVVGVRVADLEAARKVDERDSSAPHPAGTPVQRLPTDDADTERVMVGRLTGARRATPTPDPGKPGSGPNSGFKPSVTAFWIPSPVEEAAAALETPARPPRSSSPGQGTIVVTGAQTGSGPHQMSPWTPPGAVSGPIAAPTGSDKAAFRLGGYEIATRLSQAGGSSIYVCRRAGGGPGSRLFTLKVVRQRSDQAADVIQAFRREARVGALLNHPNLQTVVDVGSYHEQPFLILDYVESVSLDELMGGKTRMPVGVVVSILLDVLQGLRSAHDVVDEQGMRLELVHGDVTPHNILVGIDGNARLTDFGSARFGSDARAMEIAPLPTGKPGFLSPEQLCDAPLDGRTDLFSLGVVMWSALTGQSLFAAETRDQTVANIFRKRIPPPSEMGAPPGLDEILVRALSRSPEGRFNNAAEMAEELARAAAAAGLSGSPADVRNWVRREAGEAVLERQRRIQTVFGGPPVVGWGATPPSSPVPRPAPGTTPVAVVPPLQQAAQAVTTFKAGVGAPSGARKPTPGGALVRRAPARRDPPPPATERLSTTKVPRVVQWRVVLVSGLIAFPFTLVLAYLASVPLMRHLFPTEPERTPAGHVGRLPPPSAAKPPTAASAAIGTAPAAVAPAPPSGGDPTPKQP
jgi:serine/threonine-protein kinase